MRHFLRDDDLHADEQAAVIAAAARMAGDPGAALGSVTPAAIGLFFEKPSLRTRVSTEIAAARIGAQPVQLRPDELQLARGESVSDTARVLGGYLRVLMARVFDHGLLEALATEDSLSVVNGLSDRFHPLQTLADLLTLHQEWNGSLSGRTLVYVGDGNNVATSLLLGAPMRAMRVIVACPPGYAPDPEIVEVAAGRASAYGGEAIVTDDAVAAVSEADALYADVWTSMGDEGEEVARRAALAPYQLNSDLLGAAPADSVVLHCLPAHRGEEITADVIDGDRSRVFPQAHNRLPSAASLFLFLCDPGRVFALGAGSDGA